jgi:hypothetical protein
LLGTRRFSIDPATSSLEFVLPGYRLTNTGFEGFLDLTVGVPDPTTGQAFVDVTGASEFIALDLNPEAELVVCIRPLAIPVSKAGIIDCDGGIDLGISAQQDHHLGEVGVDGFSAEDCADAGGSVETADDLHPNVCNGPLEMDVSGENDSGPGAVKIAFDDAGGIQGLPVELTVESALPCGDEGEGTRTVLALVSALSRATILDVDDKLGETFTDEERGENFSCRAWVEENGPGRLVVALPALHGFVGADMASVFRFDD